jgi:long-chain acyl-CoA synthetase
MHRSERTVHEQILFRLQSKRRPVTYHDVIEGQIVARDTAEVRREMLAAAEGLRVLGIQPGDRVAIVGLNSTRYLTLDVAIGLVGAVSVPVYYTSPLADIDAILTASGASLLFVGAPKVLARSSELTTPLPIVSFCRGTSPESVSQNVMSWENFLSLAKPRSGFLTPRPFVSNVWRCRAQLGIGSNPDETEGRPTPGARETREVDPMSVASAPVSFGDVATLRYTSGTTGDSHVWGGKGVKFHHAHLRWMGECVAALLPWKVRNAPAAYLSFLPMNHVVEGILATYAPYYLPAPVNITFLENVYDLARTLPRVRPTIFFTVPRVYEKVWEGVQKSKFGQFYLGLKVGVLRRMFRPLLRWSVLRKAGFDRCAQLIVGSAPASETLLRNFHELGIEIHNAYGLTEAPLITLNRLGANRIGTVGAPLPETEIRVAEDGEVMVRGPQVATGYANSGNDAALPFKDGWLLTGDLGCVTGEGNLVIQGRKKELIKTSYGKYVQVARVEALLRDIPAVAEAMVVGEGKPYCVALLWMNDDRWNKVAAKALDCAVLKANTHLSHPEQVKRWAVLANDLSIEGGDLTANLKLKRQAVSRRLHDVIESLYCAGCIPASTLHVGEARREETA